MLSARELCQIRKVSDCGQPPSKKAKRGSIEHRPPLASGRRQISSAELVGAAMGAVVDSLVVAHVRQVVEDH